VVREGLQISPARTPFPSVLCLQGSCLAAVCSSRSWLTSKGGSVRESELLRGNCWPLQVQIEVTHPLRQPMGPILFCTCVYQSFHCTRYCVYKLCCCFSTDQRYIRKNECWTSSGYEQVYVHTHTTERHEPQNTDELEPNAIYLQRYFQSLSLIVIIWWDNPNHLALINSQIIKNGCIKSTVNSSSTRSKGSPALLIAFDFIHSVSHSTSAAICTKFRNHDTCLKNKMLIRRNGLGLYLESRNVNCW